MFKEKYVKIERKDWEQIKTDYNELLKEGKDLKSIMKTQSDTFETLSKYKNQDDVLYSYEQELPKLRSDVKLLKKESDNLAKRLRAEIEISKLLIEELGKKSIEVYRKCDEYETVSLLDIEV